MALPQGEFVKCPHDVVIVSHEAGNRKEKIVSIK